MCGVNLCRSVLAERLSRRDLMAVPDAAEAGFEFGSAGIAGQDGMPMHPYTAEVLAMLGAQCAGFSSRRLTGEQVGAADLILTAGLEHKDAAVAACPQASRRTYLIREFVRLVRHVDSPRTADLAERARQMVGEAARLRGRIPWADPAADEIVDPAASRSAFLACGRVVERSAAEILAVLCGTRGGPSPGQFAWSAARSEGPDR